MRKSTISAVMSELNRRRKTKAGGRPRIPTPCQKCGADCPSARAARAHCQARS